MSTNPTFRNRFILSALALFIFLFSALSLSASPLTGAVFVSPSGHDNADCLSLATACQSIHVAISRSTPGDAILIASGEYTDSFTIDKPLSLIGYGPTQPIINGIAEPEAQRVITVSTGINATLQNLSIQRGNSTNQSIPFGGGILNSGMLTISYSTVTGNVGGDRGGGIASLDGQLLIQFSKIAGNQLIWGLDSSQDMMYGGGISILGGSLTVDHSEISGNSMNPFKSAFSDGCGGGIHNADGTVFILDSIIQSNGAIYRGSGGGFCNSAVMVINRSQIFYNGGTQGKAISNGGQMTITESEIAGGCTQATSASQTRPSKRPDFGWPTRAGGILNSGSLRMSRSVVDGNCTDAGLPANGGGGGILSEGSADLVNVTVSHNSAQWGGALSGNFTLTNVTISDNRSWQLSGSVSGNVSLVNTIIGNAADVNCTTTSTVTSLGNNISSDGSCNFTASGDITNTNPLLGPLQDNGGNTLTHALLFGSPANDRGNNVACPATDQRGVPRPQGPACDIGAYEETLILHRLLPLVSR